MLVGQQTLDQGPAMEESPSVGAAAAASYSGVGVSFIVLSVVFVLLRLAVNLNKAKRVLAEDGERLLLSNLEFWKLMRGR